MFNLFLLCRKDEISFDTVAVIGNEVVCCFEKVERCIDIVAGVDGALRRQALDNGYMRKCNSRRPNKDVLMYSAVVLRM